MALNKQQIITLRTCRQKAALVDSLKLNLQEASACLDGIKAPDMSGMPKGGGASSDAYLNDIARRDKLAAQLLRAEEDLTRIRMRAEEIVAALEEPLSLFAQMYYIYAHDLEETAMMIGRSDKTCRKYKSQIEG